MYKMSVCSHGVVKISTIEEAKPEEARLGAKEPSTAVSIFI